MNRDPVEITKKSAASIAKWRMQMLLDEDDKLPSNKQMNMLKKFSMKQAILPGGPVDEIAAMLYDLGIHLSIDKNNEEHASWIKANAVILEPQ